MRSEVSPYPPGMPPGLPPGPLTDLSDLIERLDHIAIGVVTIEAGLPMMGFVGGIFVNGGDHLSGNFRWAQFELKDGSRLELIAPLSPDSFVQRFLDQRGEGLHHITYKVSDVQVAADRANALGYRTTGLEIDPRWSEVFLHPTEAHGVLIQLAAWPDNPWPPTTLEDVLKGRIIDD